MIATGAILLTIVGLNTWAEVTILYPMQAQLAVAAGMTVPMVAWMMHQDDRANGRVVDRGHDLGLPGHDMEHFAVRWGESMTGAACGRSPWEVKSSFDSALPNALLAVSRGPYCPAPTRPASGAPVEHDNVSDLEHARLALLRQGCSARFEIDLGPREFGLGDRPWCRRSSRPPSQPSWLGPPGWG